HIGGCGDRRDRHTAPQGRREYRACAARAGDGPRGRRNGGRPRGAGGLLRGGGKQAQGTAARDGTAGSAGRDVGLSSMPAAALACANARPVPPPYSITRCRGSARRTAFLAMPLSKVTSRPPSLTASANR